VSALKPWHAKQWSSQMFLRKANCRILQQCAINMHGRNQVRWGTGQEASLARGVTRGAQFPGCRITIGALNHCGGRRKLQCQSAFFNVVHLLPTDVRFKHGAPNLGLAPGAIWPCYAPEFDAPVFESEVVRKQMHCTVLKKVLATLLGLFWAPCSDLAPS